MTMTCGDGDADCDDNCYGNLASFDCYVDYDDYYYYDECDVWWLC